VSDTDAERPLDRGLAARGIVVRFGGLQALDGISVAAPIGRITGLIGPNGAGKTTLFNVCCGFQKPDAGTVTLDGQDISAVSPARRARLGLGRTFQRMELFGSLTVRENVELVATSRDRAQHLLETFGLTDLADRPAGQVSTGQGRLLELARALARGPRVLLLDEPSSGLDAAESRDFGQLLAQLVRNDDLGILMVEHDMSLVLTICEWIYVLDFGRPLMAGTPAEVRNSEAVRAAYLGRSAA
jgi:ABC-type branched-subunit amino acid transport system ATPase component